VGGAHAAPEDAFQIVQSELIKLIAELSPLTPQKRIDARIKKFGNMGVYNK